MVLYDPKHTLPSQASINGAVFTFSSLNLSPPPSNFEPEDKYLLTEYITFSDVYALFSRPFFHGENLVIPAQNGLEPNNYILTNFAYEGKHETFFEEGLQLRFRGGHYYGHKAINHIQGSVKSQHNPRALEEGGSTRKEWENDIPNLSEKRLFWNYLLRQMNSPDEERWRNVFQRISPEEISLISIFLDARSNAGFYYITPSGCVAEISMCFDEVVHMNPASREPISNTPDREVEFEVSGIGNVHIQSYSIIKSPSQAFNKTNKLASINFIRSQINCLVTECFGNRLIPSYGSKLLRSLDANAHAYNMPIDTYIRTATQWDFQSPHFSGGTNINAIARAAQNMSHPRSLIDPGHKAAFHLRTPPDQLTFRLR